MSKVVELAGETGVYLAQYLQPLAPWLDRADVTEIMVNRPQELWIETAGGAGMERHAVPALTATLLQRLAAQVARANHQGVSRAQPLLSGTLPGGARIQIIAAPATRGDLALAIRKPSAARLSLDDLAAGGVFAALRTTGAARAAADAELQALRAAGDLLGFFRAAVRQRRNILVSGGTSSGKTTFLNALLHDMPAGDRIIAIEDTPEVALDRPNAVGLIAVRGSEGEAEVTPETLLQAALRMRPDRLLLGEMRGPEAFSFLRAVNTGHPGSVSTIHANSAAAAFEQVALLALQARVNLARPEIIAYARGVIDIVVQLERAGGARVVSEILFGPDGC